MHKTRNRLFQRVLPALIAGVGSIIGLTFIGLVAQETQSMMIIAPFGATAIILFSLPHSSAAKPLSVLSGYFIASLVGALFLYYGLSDWLYLGMGFGVVLFVMQMFDVVHPPAGAHYIVVTQATLTLSSIEPLFVGLLSLLAAGFLTKKAEELLH